jgi:dTMP kinase
MAEKYMKNKGIFITVEGPEGSGKSTMVREIQKWLEEVVKRPFLITKEPGSPHDNVCKNLRALMLNPENVIDSHAEIFGMMMDRCQHVNKVVRPALEEGKIVVSDRYIDSTYAYQGWGRRDGTEEALEYINFLNMKTTDNLIPDLTILMIVDPEVGLKRSLKLEFGRADRFEKEKIEFHNRLHEGFLDLFEKYKDKRNFLLIDTTDKSQSQCKSQVIDYLNTFFDNIIQSKSTTLT